MEKGREGDRERGNKGGWVGGWVGGKEGGREGGRGEGRAGGRGQQDCSRLGNVLCLCSPVRPSQAVPERWPKSLAVDFAVKTFDYRLSSGTALGSDLQMTCRG